MLLNRRNFLGWGLGTLAVSAPRLLGQEATASNGDEAQHVGCLVDTTLCIGCRKCEEACNRRNKLPHPDIAFTEQTVFRQERRPSAKAFTVVNEYTGAPSPDQEWMKETYAKVQCLHCLIPSCVSACIVGALTKTKDGAVVYNPDVCLGCRYCMVACPFQIPAYEYDVVLTPRVRKCEFCANFVKGTGADPACAAACPTEALVFGQRSSLLTLAKDRINRRPDRYVAHVYGEHEVGGTAWLYLTGRPATEVGLLAMPTFSPAHSTEAIQHGIFRYGIIPFAVYGALGGLMWYNHRRTQQSCKPDSESGQQVQEARHE
jgi:Fe-S-cluster-containing dehydrogenase component